MIKYVGKKRIQNASPDTLPKLNLKHCYSASIISEDDKNIEIQITSLLDPVDYIHYEKTIIISVKDFNQNFDRYCIKI